MTNYDVGIIGGGPPGLALSALLGRAGLHVALIDAEGPVDEKKQPDGRNTVGAPDGRTVALMGASIDTLGRCGVWPDLAAQGAALSHMAVVDDSRFPAGDNAMIEQMFNAHELDREAFGWNLPLNTLRAALAKQIAPLANVTHHTSAVMTSFETSTDQVRIHLKDKKTITAKLIVGCDGRNSVVRAGAGIDVTRRPYGQRAITCIIAHTHDHNNTSTEFHRPGGPFTIVPLSSTGPEKQSAIVWVEKDADADAFLKLPKPAFTAELQSRTRGRVGKVTLVTNPTSWPLEYLRAKALTAPRTALAAEAAHVISPIGAQGLNLSLRDVTTLADIITQAQLLGLDIGSAATLAQYERARKGDVLTRSFTIDAANRAVANDTQAMRALRRLTLRMLSLPGPWRQLVMKKGLAA